MYNHFFGLTENPFNLTPDPRYLYLTDGHRDALNHLIYGITERKGFIVVTGGIGTGKTTLGRALLASLADRVDTALIFNSAVSDMELLALIAREFHLKLQRGRPTRKTYIDALNQFLLKNYAAGRNAVLLIDEAQNLSPAVLEQIRMLSNLETEREKLLQIILMGQPELTMLLRSPALRQLNERIAVRYDLKPLKRDEVPRYIAHRISIADGSEPRVRFSPGCAKLIVRSSGGNPRRINVLCDRALLIAFALNTTVISESVVRKAVRDIGPAYLGTKHYGGVFPRLGLSAAILIVLLTVVALYYDPLREGVLSLFAAAGFP